MQTSVCTRAKLWQDCRGEAGSNRSIALLNTRSQILIQERKFENFTALGADPGETLPVSAMRGVVFFPGVPGRQPNRRHRPQGGEIFAFTSIP